MARSLCISNILYAQTLPQLYECMLTDKLLVAGGSSIFRRFAGFHVRLRLHNGLSLGIHPMHAIASVA